MIPFGLSHPPTAVQHRLRRMKRRSSQTPHVRPGILVSTAQMRELSLGVNKGIPDYVLLDAKPLAEYTGIVNSDAVPKAGHFTGSQRLYWKKMIRSDANPQLLDPEQLQQQFLLAWRRARYVGCHLLPHRHLVVICVFRRKVPGTPGCHVRWLGLRVGPCSRQRARKVTSAGAREPSASIKKSRQFDGGQP